jgi:protein tyrosine phosphatase (PTP) superfamily phosphohydrolase (DUF442 family)
VDFTQARNFRKAGEKRFTSGQPNEAQLESAREAGVEVVINLALHDDPRYSLRDERGTVESLGMTYVHIPVQFSAPTEADLLTFFSAMKTHRGQSILVHCGANYRVSAFLGLYNVLELGQSREEAFALLESVWKPDAVWAQFIDDMLTKYGKRRLADI